jgi:hypothetical protein
MYLRSCGSFMSANHKKDWVRKSQNPRSITFAELSISEMCRNPVFITASYLNRDSISLIRVSSLLHSRGEDFRKFATDPLV